MISSSPLLQTAYVPEYVFASKIYFAYRQLSQEIEKTLLFLIKITVQKPAISITLGVELRAWIAMHTGDELGTALRMGCCPSSIASCSDKKRKFT